MKNNKCLKIMCMLITVLCIAVCLFCVSCDPEQVITEPTSEGKRLAALQPVTSCDELVAELKERAIQDMESTIDSYVAEVTACGGCCYYYYPYPYCPDCEVYEDVAESPADGNGGAGGDDSGASEYSETNVQVAGVDEADFVKNDGSYIYILADDKFQIIDAWPAEDSQVVSKVDIEGAPKKLFVASDRALIYSSLGYVGTEGTYSEDYWYYDSECTYGYDCDFTGDNRKLKITIYDISDRSSPELLREIRFSGSYINARRIGTAIHTVVLSPVFSSPDISYWPEVMDRCWDYYGEDVQPTLEEILAAFAALREKNREIIDNSTTTDWLPGVEDARYVDGEAITSDDIFKDCNNIYESGRLEGESFMTLLSLDIEQTGDLNQTTIFGRPGAVYSSASALYVSARQEYSYSYPWYYDNSTGLKQASTVHMFKLQNDPAGCRYAGSGVVKGKVLNQFSMDEYEDHLRIATTTGYVPSPDVHSTLSILKESSGELEIVGQIDNIAPTEDIRSVRFDGTRAFIVTFKKTDPLFAFDLSNPTAPRIEGELKIPGYSTYMHLMDDNHLLTIGYDADDQGDFAFFQGIMLQIFDVSDMSDPKLLHKEVIGTRGSTSEAATNHLAFNYFAPKDLLAIPMTICESGSGGSNYGDEMTFSGLLVYEVTTGKGFVELGGVSHVEPDSKNSWEACGSWWTNSNSVVKRSIFMDDYVYSVALDQIKVDSVDNVGHDVSVIDLLEE